VQYLPKEQQGMSISGYQPKLQMVMEDGAFAVVESKGNYILKPSPVDFPQLAENEHDADGAAGIRCTATRPVTL